MDLKGEKLQVNLLPWDALEEVIKLLMACAKAHGDADGVKGWEKIPPEIALATYRGAISRHSIRMMQGKYLDESGFPVEACIAADALIALSLRLKNGEK